ncbi:hypothetical protein GJAV_G00156770 [Gymnothorax javanicus]|nr:hypothetical protein GJAV_G00156770 [Gymnothorax javanicus]
MQSIGKQQKIGESSTEHYTEKRTRELKASYLREFFYYGEVASIKVLLIHFCDSTPRVVKKSEPRECLRRNIPKKMLRELSKLTTDMATSLPSDDIKHLKLLCKFGKSMKKSKGIRILKELVDFYQAVFKKVSLKDETQRDLQIILSRLGTEVQHCLGPDIGRLRRGERNCIKKMNGTFLKLKSQGVSKAVGEFHLVLGWLDSYIHQKTARRAKTRPVMS